MNFDQAFDKLLGHEGGYSDHDDDPGGKTRYGVTEAVAREVGYKGDMRDLPLDLAKRIYLERYWKPIRADELPADIRYAVFDAAVNSGPVQAVKWLQRACSATPDGVIGPQTLLAVKASDPTRVEARMLGHRLDMMNDLKNWPSFSRGWAQRIAELLMEV